MQSLTPFNNDVPEFAPSREAPIYPSIVRRYPCQENNIVGDDGVGNFRSLTWKIQQPDSSMVWTSVKLVMPIVLEAQDVNDNNLDMRVSSRLPGCNIALSESPMRVFRDTTLSLNGKIFNEVNSYRNILDACYRGVGPQSYGDNHSLKPVVTRALFNRDPNQVVNTRLVNGTPEATFVRVDDIKNFVTSNKESLLDNNGPFLERARIFQDNLDVSGTEWRGDISSYLEIGPFQARARKGNTAVPYIQDFHLKLNVHQVESRYDQLMNSKWTNDHSFNGGGAREARRVGPYLFEFGTVSNMHVVGEPIEAPDGFLGYPLFTFTAKPYLEITYTKFLDPMRSSYLLRCYERQYQQSLPRFKLKPGYNSNVTARVTSRLLSYPTKIYLYAEVADEWKGSFKDGGVRRSCELTNIHCRINQRPDVIYNPSQEECFETFQRHTNSSLEYGSWRKAPIYVFTPADLQQSDMYANDARITWMEWDAQVALTPMQKDENYQAQLTQAISASGYVETERAELIYATSPDFADTDANVEIRCDPRSTATIYHDAATLGLQLYSASLGSAELKIPFDNPETILNRPLVSMEYENQATGTLVQPGSEMDMSMTAITGRTMALDGYLWALVKSTGPDMNEIMYGNIYYVPRSYRFVPDDEFPCGTGKSCVNPFSVLAVTTGADDAKGDVIYAYTIAGTPDLVYFKGTIADTKAGAGGNGKKIGYAQADADWKAAAPGKVAVFLDPAGIRNANNTVGTGAQTYLHMGKLPFDINAGPEKAPAVDETKVDPNNPRWICIAPPAHWANQADAAWKFRSDSHEQLADLNSPLILAAGTNPPQKLGAQRLFFQGRADNARIDVAIKDRVYTRQDPGTAYGREGIRLAVLVPNVPSDADIHEDYQLKVLYEYGNCQYEFSDQALPTRVIENLLPVSASAGIPTF